MLIAKECYIGIDVGTQGTKAVLYDATSQHVIGRASKSYGLVQDVPGRAEQDPAVWVDAVTCVLRDLSDKFNLAGDEEALKAAKGFLYEVKGIGVSGQQHGMVVLDKDYKVIRPAKLWCDVEAAAEAEEFSKNVAGRAVAPGFTAPKVKWLKMNEPENYAKMKHCCLPHDYINFLLTGEQEITTDAGDASGTGVFDIIERKFDLKLANNLTNDECYSCALPRVLDPNEIAGHLSTDWKKKVSIDKCNKVNIVISAGSGDNMCSALGSGCVPSDGKVVLSLGTSGTIFAASDSPIADTSGIVAPFCDATGGYLPLVCVMSCTGVLQEVLDHWCSMVGVGDHDEASKLAETVNPGCEGVNFIPFLDGERTPNLPTASGSLLGLKKGSMRPGLIYRAALEGITYNLFEGLENMIEMSGGLRPSGLLCVGGGSKNKLWRQIIADIFQLPLKFPTEPESAALGAAFQAGAASQGIAIHTFVSKQNVHFEDDVVEPTKDAEKILLYKEGLARHREFISTYYGST